MLKKNPSERIRIEGVVDFLKKCDIRASFDDRSEKIGRKIRDAETKKIPYMVVIGEQEMTEENLAVRKHGEGDKGKMNLNEFAELIHSQHPDKLS